MYAKTKEGPVLDLESLYPSIKAQKTADVIEGQVKSFSEVLESKRNRQTSFGNLNKKDPRANNRNYLKGKK